MNQQYCHMSALKLGGINLFGEAEHPSPYVPVQGTVTTFAAHVTRHSLGRNAKPVSPIATRGVGKVRVCIQWKGTTPSRERSCSPKTHPDNRELHRDAGEKRKHLKGSPHQPLLILHSCLRA